MDRAAAAKIGGMDRQTLRDWVHRFNALGPEGLIDTRTEGPKPRLSEEQLAQFAKIVEAGPDREERWRRPVAAGRPQAWSRRGSASNFIRAMSESFEEARLLAHQRPAAPSGLRTSGSSRRLKNFPRALKAHLGGISETTLVEIWFQDEARIIEERLPSASGPAERGPYSPLTNATTTPICSARSARREAWERRWRCPTLIPT